MALGSRCPWPERKLAQPRQLMRIGNFNGLAPDQHAPASASGSIGTIDLERHPAAAASQVKLGSLVSADHHHVAIEDKVDGNHDRPALIDEGEPAQGFPRQQLEAL